MKVTAKQMERSHIKLARAIGRWNVPDGDRRAKTMELWRAAFLVIKKAGLFNEYQTAIKKEFAASKEKSNE